MDKEASKYPDFEALSPDLQDQLLQSAQIAADTYNIIQRLRKPENKKKEGAGRPKAATRSLRSYFAGEAAYKLGLQLLTQNRTPAGAASVFLFLQECHPELLSGSRTHEPAALYKAIERELCPPGEHLGRASGFRRKLNEGLTENSRTTIAALQDLYENLLQ